MQEEPDMWSMLWILWQYCHLNGGLFCVFVELATSDDQPIKFMVKYGVSRKIVPCQVHEFANIYMT